MYTANKKIETFHPAYRRRYEPSRRHLIFCLLITALLCLTAATNTASAATYYLDAVNGNDSYDGLAPEWDGTHGPWKTMTKAESSAVNGSTVYLRSGNYGEVTINSTGLNRTSWNDGVTYIAEDANTPPVFDKLDIRGSENRYLTIKNISVTAPGIISANPTYTYSAAVLIGDSSHIKLIDCNISGWWAYNPDLTQNGILVYAKYNPISDILIDGCDIQQANIGIFLYNDLRDNIIVRNCKIHKIAGTYLKVSPDTHLNSEILIENNHLYDARKMAWDHGGSGIGVRGSHMTIRGNIIRDFGGSGGIRFYGYPPTGYTHEDILIENNLIYDSDGPTGTYFGNMNKDITIRNNTFLGHEYTSGVYKYRLGVSLAKGAVLTATNIKFHNNIVMGVFEVDPGVELQEDNNIIWSYDYLGVWVTSPPLGQNTKIIQPINDNYFEGSGNFFAGGVLFDKYGYSHPYDHDFSITEVNANIDTFGIKALGDFYEDWSTWFFVGETFVVTGSTGNDGTWTIAATPSYNNITGVTTIPVTGDITSAVAGGTITYRNPDAYGSDGGNWKLSHKQNLNDAYQLAAGSAAIGFADPAYAPNSDILGVSRVFPPDAGCYEYVDPNSQSYSITASAGNGGQIIPSGTTQVASGSSQTYTFTADPGYDISDVVVDGNSVGVRTIYTFSNVTANHTIDATFAVNTTYTITATPATPGPGGQISPSGTTQVASGGSQTYTITANTGYQISDVVVDGSSVGAVTSYPFTNVTANHTIAATFAIVEVDITAPTVTNLSPQANSIQAPLNTLLILHVVDDGKGVDPESVTINVNDNLVYSGNKATHSSAHGKCHRIGTKANYTFIYQPKQNFEFDEPVSVKVKAKDLAGNPMDEYSYSFKTEMRSFGRNTRVDPRDVKKGRPVTVCDSNGDIWAAWHAGVADSRDIYIGKLLVDEEYFDSSIQLTSDAAECNPVTATGSDGKLYVAWQDNRNGNWDIYVSTSNDWFAEIRVTDSNDNQINPAIVVDSSLPNNAYIVWEDDRNGNQDIYVARSSNDFATKTVSQITSNGSDQVEPAIAVDTDNTVYVVWTDTRNGGNNDIYGAASNDPWTNIPIVTEEESQSSPAIATEAVGSILHLVWVDDRTTDGDDDIFYDKTTGGLSPLTGSSIIDDDTGADQISPVIITTGTGNDLKVFACWRDERNANADLYLAEISSDYSAKISSGDKANVFVGDDGTNSDQSEPAIGIDGDGHPYLVWTNERTDICYAGSTFIESKLASTNVSITSETTVGTMRNAIQSVDDVSAELPQGAYLCDIEVTISRIKNPPKFNFERFTGVYEFGPSGMEFTKPVTITIPYEVYGSENVLYKAYWYNSLTNTLSQEGIADIQTIVTPSGLHALRFKTTHFSPFIIGGVLGGLGGFFGGGGGGGCSMSPDSQASIVELLLPYIGLTMAMVILKLRDRRKRETGNITKSEC